MADTFEERLADRWMSGQAITFDEVLIDLVNETSDRFVLEGKPKDEILMNILYFVRNVGDVMNLNLKDDDFRRIIGTFYTDMINEVMKEE